MAFQEFAELDCGASYLPHGRSTRLLSYADAHRRRCILVIAHAQNPRRPHPDRSISRSAAAVLADVHPCYAPNVHAGPAARMQRRLPAGKGGCLQAKPRAYRQSPARTGKRPLVRMQAQLRACRAICSRADVIVDMQRLLPGRTHVCTDGRGGCIALRRLERMVTFLLVFTRINDLTTGPIGKIRSPEFVHKRSSYLQIRMVVRGSVQRTIRAVASSKEGRPESRARRR